MNRRSFGRVRNFSSANPKSKIKNRKWAACFAIIMVLAGWVRLVEAQQAGKVAKIGYLSGSGGKTGVGEPWQVALRKLGYVEGKNFTVERRYANNKLDRLPALAVELVRLKVDVILTFSSPAVRAAKNATKTIPIVFLTEGDTVVGNLVDSLARPGANVTGFTTISPVLAGKRLELLKETVPKLTRVAVLWTSGGGEQSWEQSQLSGRELGLQVHSMTVASAGEFATAFKAVKARSMGLAVVPSALINSNRKLIADLAAENQLPAIYPREEFVDNGGLMSYGADRDEPYPRLAIFVDKILKGTSPADIPVEQPMRFELVINFKTAKALGLTIPPIVLMRATRVVK
jgi:putative ABC transport system substrate-binding protein